MQGKIFFSLLYLEQDENQSPKILWLIIRLYRIAYVFEKKINREGPRMNIDDFKDLPRETLLGMLEDFAKNWLAHDGLWFQAVEKETDMQTAIKLDTVAWEKFTIIEAKRIKRRHNIPDNGGLEALKKALKYRLYAVLNRQTVSDETATSFVFKMVDCRVQSARERKELPLFPCKPVGIVEYAGFARTIDPRIKTECIACPPDPPQRGFYCGWRFSI